VLLLFFHSSCNFSPAAPIWVDRFFPFRVSFSPDSFSFGRLPASPAIVAGFPQNLGLIYPLCYYSFLPTRQLARLLLGGFLLLRLVRAYIPLLGQTFSSTQKSYSFFFSRGSLPLRTVFFFFSRLRTPPLVLAAHRSRPLPQYGYLLFSPRSRRLDGFSFLRDLLSRQFFLDSLFCWPLPRFRSPNPLFSFLSKRIRYPPHFPPSGSPIICPFPCLPNSPSVCHSQCCLHFWFFPSPPFG